VFTILSDHLFNEESPYCIVPEKYKVLNKLVDTNNDGVISEQEITSAIAILEKAKKEKAKKEQQKSFLTFNNEIIDGYSNLH
jgi:hypothetical protein